MSTEATTTARSTELYRRACELIPAGVSSPVRAFKAVGGTPRFVARGEGARIIDEDGASYLDYCMSFGPLILGHAHPEVVDAVTGAAKEGLTFGAPSRREIALAERMVAAYPALERVRFVSSGTEAVMSAVRLARGFTGRDLVVKFDGCYHGHADHLLVAAGSGLLTFASPSSAGVPKAFAEKTLVLPLDDEEALETVFRERGGEIAAVVIEPVPANAGLLVQRDEFLERVREVTAQYGALLIFDEVITGFRLGMAGAAGDFGITPDLATFGKIIGGGMPVGAFGGRKDVMERIAPLGDVYQAGTLSGNPVAMAAGETTLRILERDRIHEKIELRGERLEAGLRRALSTSRVPGCVVRKASLFWILLQAGPPPRRVDSIRKEAAIRFAPLHAALLGRGIYLAPSAYEVGFLSAAHTDEDVDASVASFEEALRHVEGGGEEIE
jgi:glutamate-1-semialdehyde 2,1-aminomutase